jgi:Ni/Co efflux regulator RcnB
MDGVSLMSRRIRTGLPFALAALMLAGTAMAADPEPGHDHPAPAARPAPAAHAAPVPKQGEPHPGPQAYQRVTQPQGATNRPTAVDKPTYQHNYQAARTYKIGPYRQPAGWTARRWTYGQILPRAYWAASYILADYWLFGLEVPPVGFEWVRDGADALLINTTTGEILVAYGRT